eukprot:TRINITY_DN15960_c0_g1_i1.p1 TRINITY_DN15960_c0_g1~~TRINITY_DN15960_c0_g1_i1.p1  ORF type:complete len:143 (+),score=53.55 TRINITY_DN15960_c0_g1_i1:28-456(+)
MPRTNVTKSKLKKKAKAKKGLKAKAFIQAAVESQMEVDLPVTATEPEEIETSAPKKENHGTMVRRHKQETKQLRAEIEIMEAQRNKLHKRNCKDERRQITREIRKKEESLKQRHEAELASLAENAEGEKAPEVKTGEMTIEM